MNKIKLQRTSLFLCIFSTTISFLAACGKITEKFGRIEQGQSKIEFVVPQDPAAAVLVRGIMIYVYSVNPGGYSTTLKLNSEDDAPNRSLQLPNGLYRILALGWNGASPLAVNPGAGGLRCAYGNGGLPLALNGQSETIQLNMSNDGCGFQNSAGTIMYPADVSSYAFTNGGGIKSFKVASISFCASGAFTGAAGTASSCTTPSSTYGSAYMRVALVGYQRQGDNIQVKPASESFLTDCTAAATGVLNMGHIPPGNPNFPGLFYTKILIYGADSTCASNPIQVLDFRNGFSRNDLPNFPTLIYAPGSSVISHFLVNAGS